MRKVLKYVKAEIRGKMRKPNICEYLTCIGVVLFFYSKGIAAPVDIIQSFPSPGSSPQGLAWDGTYLWNTDDSTDKIYKLDPVTGNVLYSFSSPGPKPRGLTWDGNYLWWSDDSMKKIYKLSTLGDSILTIDAPSPGGEGPWQVGGLAWDGEYLWSGCIAGWSNRMSKIDVVNDSVVKFYFGYSYPRALASDGVFLRSATDNGGHRLGILYKYRLSDGKYVSCFGTPGYWPTGLAFDSQYLWCTDKEMKKIYRIKVE